MTITLNHTIVPTRDKAAASKFFAHIFGLKRGRAGYFAPVRINKTLTLLFDDDSKFESHHLAFHVRSANSTRSLTESRKPRSPSAARRGVGAAAAASISAIPTGMCWRS